MDNIPKNISHEIINKVKEIDSKLEGLYEDFKKQYVNWKMNVDIENSESQNIFENTKQNIIIEKEKLSKLNLEIINENDKLNKKIFVLKRLIEKNKNTFSSLKEIESEQNLERSNVLINDTYTVYYNNYLYNILLFVGIIILIVLSMKLGNVEFKEPTPNFTLGFFVVYVIILLVYIYKYGAKEYFFVILIIPFFIFSVALFLQNKNTKAITNTIVKNTNNVVKSIPESPFNNEVQKSLKNSTTKT